MPLSAKPIHLAALVLTLGIVLGGEARPSSAADNSTVTAGGVTLHSVGADFPDPGRLFPGGDSANAINNNCLACHSSGMVLTQPKLSRAEWQAEVEKMRKTYKAPIGDEDVPAIVDYLVSLTSGK
jgi:cytochrome c5